MSLTQQSSGSSSGLSGSGWSRLDTLPEHVIENYNQCMGWTWPGPSRLWAYLFWGAEYWVLREQQGDPEYIAAFRRVLEAG